MFKRRANHQTQLVGARRPRVGHVRSRRLGFELMERRQMLSAAPTDASALNVQFNWASLTSISEESSEFRRVGSPIAGEGGFVELNLSTSRTNYQGMSDSNEVLNGNELSLELLLAGGPVTASSTFGLTTAFSAIEASSQLRPVVVVLPDNGANAFLAEPIQAKDWTLTALRDLGGSIPIESLLPGAAPASGLESGERLLASQPAQETSEAASRSGSIAPLSSRDDSLAGEWARAMVFETIGGEPSSSAADVRAKSGNVFTTEAAVSAAVGPLSTSAAPQAAASGQRTIVGGSRFVAVAGENSEASMYGVLRSENSAPHSRSTTSLNAVQQQSDSEWTGAPLAVRLATGVAEPGIVAAVLSTKAYEEVFEQLDANSEAIMPTLDDNTVRQAAAFTAPLALALVLERIAANHARRSSAEPSAVPTLRPRRTFDRYLGWLSRARVSSGKYFTGGEP